MLEKLSEQNTPQAQVIRINILLMYKEKIKLGILFTSKNILVSRMSHNELIADEYAENSTELSEIESTLTSHEKRLGVLRNKYGTATRISQKEFWSQLSVL